MDWVLVVIRVVMVAAGWCVVILAESGIPAQSPGSQKDSFNPASSPIRFRRPANINNHDVRAMSVPITFDQPNGRRPDSSIHFITTTDPTQPVFVPETSDPIIFSAEKDANGRMTPILIEDLESILRVAIYVPHRPCTGECEFHTTDGRCAEDFQCIEV